MTSGINTLPIPSWAVAPPPPEGGLPPEDAGRVALDFVNEFFDAGCRLDEVVLVELQVAVAPVQRPLIADLRIAEAADREPGPLRAEVLPPRRPTFKRWSTGQSVVDALLFDC